MQVMCKQCLTVKDVPPGVDPHTLTWCNCCTQDHHHGAGAAACQPEASHPGQACWNPPWTPRPDGCGVCRPVVHLPVTGDLQFTRF